jgi:hypothetical protein
MARRRKCSVIYINSQYNSVDAEFVLLYCYFPLFQLKVYKCGAETIN